MSLRLDMLRAMSLSHKTLGESASLVGQYLRSQVTPQGGFGDRSGMPDLYYTVFGLDAMVALGEPVPKQTVPYVLGFGLGEALDFVHFCCLIRCRASAGIEWGTDERDTLAARLETYRSNDGGYHQEPGADAGSAYGCFLALMAYEDLGLPVSSPEGMLRCLRRLRSADGGYANQPDQLLGLTPSTAAVATLLAALGDEFPAELDDWLLSRCCPEGGFFAVPAAPIPDLLSTATALHALARMGAPLDSVRVPCLDFIGSLWSGGGAFGGSWADRAADCEYTYYGLLALGSLA